MPNYRRWRVPGASYFFTVVTFNRKPIFADSDNIVLHRQSLGIVMADMPFHFDAAVILPDHIHFLWTLPDGDTNYSKRIGFMKVKFTQLLHRSGETTAVKFNKRHESNVWQPRFHEHTIEDDNDYGHHLDYIHYNPVKHGHCRCPHEWSHSSFRKWVQIGEYDSKWGCNCEGKTFDIRYLDVVGLKAGE